MPVRNGNVQRDAAVGAADMETARRFEPRERHGYNHAAVIR